VRRGPGTLYRRLKSIEYALTRDRRAIWSFLFAEYPLDLSTRARLGLVSRFFETTNLVRAYHTQEEMLIVADAILRRAKKNDLTVIEAGSGKGASTAKLSLATRLAGGRLLVFDSFRGIPANEERHEHVDGRSIIFREGAFLGRLSAVKRTVSELGAIEVCEFHKGLFEDTLPRVIPSLQIDVALLDVDLLSSTRTCIKAIYPRLAEGGVIFTTDGHLKSIIELLQSERFWREEVGVERTPTIAGLGAKKMLEIRRDAS
jgi:O-methyltransferase